MQSMMRLRDSVGFENLNYIEVENLRKRATVLRHFYINRMVPNYISNMKVLAFHSGYRVVRRRFTVTIQHNRERGLNKHSDCDTYEILYILDYNTVTLM